MFAAAEENLRRLDAAAARRFPAGVHPAAPAAVLLAVALAACRTAPSPHGVPIARGEAEAVLAAQVAHWNAGDLRGFVATYWDGPELTFLGGSGLTRGRADLLAKYERGYPTAAARGVLSFAVLDLQPLGSEHALLLGQYKLERAEPSTGFFSLVLARRDGAVVILHDHTTESPAPFREFRF